MTNPRIPKRNGFEIIDEALPFFKLWGLRTNPNADYPQFLKTVRSCRCPNAKGITAYFSNTCPFTEFYTNKAPRDYAANKSLPITIHKISCKGDGKKMPIPWVNNSVFYKGVLKTLEMKADRHLDKLIGCS